MESGEGRRGRTIATKDKHMRQNSDDMTNKEKETKKKEISETPLYRKWIKESDK